MVCSLVNWQSTSTSSSSYHGGGRRKQQQQQRLLMGSRQQFRSNSLSKSDPTPNGKVAPLLVFQTRTYDGPTLEACCSLQSVSSYDSLDPSIVSCSETTTATTTEQQQQDHHHPLTASQQQQRQQATTMPRKKTYTVPCDCIKTVEKITTGGVFQKGYRLFFATGSRGSYELEFENKNGMDIMISFLQAFLPAERFVNLTTTTTTASSVDDSASHLSMLDVEKLTERLAERQTKETMSERIRNGLGQMLSSMEDCK
jgi:hypothetical protein